MDTSLQNLEQQLFEQQDSLAPSRFAALAEEWARLVTAEIGKDDGKHDLKLLLEPLILKVQEKAFSGNAVILLNALSEAVESQLPLAEYLHAQAQPDKLKSQVHVLLREADYPEAAWITSPSALVEFLKKPMTPETTANFTAAQPSFPAEKAAAFYQTYWGLSHKEQAAFIGKVLDAPSDNKGRAYRDFKKAISSLVDSQLKDEFLPPDTRAQYGDASAYHIGQMIIKGSMVSSPQPKLIAGLFASLLDAVHGDAIDQSSPQPRTTDPDVRFGYRLGAFMSNLGSGAAKTAQYGHSMPLTPKAWMDGLSTSKSEAGRPLRVEYLRWVDEKVNPEIRKHIKRIGEHKGTGSYVSTYGLEFEDGYVQSNPNYERYCKRYADKELVLSLLKDNARESALEFASYFLELGDAIVSFEPKAKNSIGPLMEIVRQGIGMVERETDLNYSARQEGIVDHINENLRIHAGNYDHSFYTQGAMEYGKEFRTSICVTGKHFNDLAEGTSEEKAFKRAQATMMFTRFLYIALSGQAMNHDEHGKNEGIDKKGANSVEVGLFDSGAQAMEEPTAVQKRMFADCLMDALANSIRNGYGVPSSLKHTVAKAAASLDAGNKSDIDYINSIQRAAVSEGDYMKYMKPRDYVQAFLAVAQTGELDTVILSTLAKRTVSLGLNKSGDKVAELPFIGSLMSGVQRFGATLSAYKLPVLNSITGWMAEERQHEQKFYPDNPNPNRGQKKARTESKSDTPTDAPKEKAYPIPVHISGGKGEQSLLGKIASLAATALKVVVR